VIEGENVLLFWLAGIRVALRRPTPFKENNVLCRGDEYNG